LEWQCREELTTAPPINRVVPLHLGAVLPGATSDVVVGGDPLGHWFALGENLRDRLFL